MACTIFIYKEIIFVAVQIIIMNTDFFPMKHQLYDNFSPILENMTLFFLDLGQKYPQISVPVFVNSTEWFSYQ